MAGFGVFGENGCRAFLEHFASLDAGGQRRQLLRRCNSGDGRVVVVVLDDGGVGENEIVVRAVAVEVEIQVNALVVMERKALFFLSGNEEEDEDDDY